MPETSTTLFFATLGALIVGARYYFRNYNDGSSSSTSSGTTSTDPSSSANASDTHASNAARREITEDMVSVVSVIVPKVSRETIRRDLEITHSIESTTHRLLEAEKKKKGNTLFDRYGVDAESMDLQSSESVPEEPKDSNWADVREKREAKLRKQREDMLLKARQRTLELSQK